MVAVPPVWTIPRSHPLYYRARRQSHRERGLCLNCTQPAVEGKAQCLVCARRVRRIQEAEKHRERHKEFVRLQYQYRVDNGLCVSCRKPMGMYDEAGLVNCRRCRDEKRERVVEANRQRREARRAAGLCHQCGQKPPPEGYARCAECRAKNAKRRRRAA